MIVMVWFTFMVFNATFNNISVIMWRSFSLVEENRVPIGKNTDLLIGTDCTGSCKSNYHAIMTMTALMVVMKLIDI